MPALTCFAAPVISPRASAAAGEIPLLMPGKSSVRNSFGNFDSEHELLSPAWSVERSASLYNIHGWGAPYFTVNAHGHISIRPFGDKTQDHQEIDLMEVVGRISDTRSASGLGLQLPAIIRFPHVLKNRLECLQSAFDVAIESQGYESHYQGVYPVKCNQDRFIVEDIVEFGTSFHFGLEAGSKPELLLAMSCLAKGSPNAFLICNGYKDAEYISLALIAKKMNLNTMIVLEQEEELDLVIKISKNLGISPVLGLRAKLRTNHTGHFGSTSGEKGKFGLNSIQIINVVKKLKKSGMLDCLQLLHFHIGSQIPSTDLLCHGVQEAAQIYCDLVHFGANMGIIDIGGGLGIDYDGTKSTHSDISVGYGLNEYASAVVKTIRNVCNRKFVKHPVISSESGRALVSHHSVLIFEATTGTNTKKSPMDLSHAYKSLIGESISNYRNLISAALRGEYETCLLYADQLKSHCVHQFKEGSIGLEQLAAVDNLYDMVSNSVANSSDSIRKYNVNLSLFTSIPDFWAIGQLFPITPIHRLNQRPTVNGVLVDLTCDSDGKVDRFIGGKKSLPLHETESGSGYYLGMFLGGAYQEALGGSHNLFGSPNVVRVTSCDGPTNFTATQVSMGKTCADVLGHMQHEPESMLATLTRQAESCGLDKQAMATYLQRQFNSSPYLVSNAGR